MKRFWIYGLCAAALAAAPASAAWYVKFDGIDGESKVTSVGFKGGVRVASGDVTGDGSTDTADTADGDVDGRDYQVWRRTGSAGNAAGEGQSGTLSAGSDPQAIGLLLPAVQKVREATAARPAGLRCEVGQSLHNLVLYEDQSGRRVLVPEAQVTACAHEEISFNFTKVEAMPAAPARATER